MTLLRGAFLASFRAFWVTLHLYLPTLYHLGYKQEIRPPLFRNRVGHYESYMRMGQEWSRRVVRLQNHWTTFRDVCMVLLGYGHTLFLKLFCVD